MIAEIGKLISHQRLQGFSLRAHLPRAFRIRGDAHVVIGHRKERVSRSAWAKFNLRFWLDGMNCVRNGPEKVWKLLHGIEGVPVMVCRICAARHRVQKLSIQFKAIEPPYLEDALGKRLMVVHHLRNSGTKV